LVAGSHSILARWRKYFSQLLSVHGVDDVRQTEIHKAEPLVPEPSTSEFELAIGKLKSHRLLGIDQIPAELIKAGCRTIRFEIHKLIISVWNKEELPEGWKESIIVHIYKEGDKTDCSIYRHITFASCLQTFIQHPAVTVNSKCRGNYWDHQCRLQHNRSTTDYIFFISQIPEKKCECYEAVYHLFIYFKKAYDSIRRGGLI
jgi:sorting nexin-29